MLPRAIVALFTLLPLSLAAQTTAPAASPGIVVGDIDPAIKPGDNFYLYANGKWQARTEIPADRAGVSAFSRVADIADARVKAIIDDAVKAAPAARIAAPKTVKPAPRTDQRRIADLYRSVMDEATIESRGLTPLKPQLDAIAAIGTSRELAHALGLTLRADVDALNNTNFHTANVFGLWVAPGFNDPAHYAPYLFQGGLLLPSRDYYLTNTPGSVEMRKRYLLHAIAMFKLAGYDHPEIRALRALEIELALARKHVSLADNENIEHANNPWKLADFEYNAPGINWQEFFAAAGLSQQTSFIVWQPKAIAGEVAIISSADLESWRNYLILHLLEANVLSLPKAFRTENFSFFGTVLGGATAERPRSEIAVTVVNFVLGDAVGRTYVDRFFPAAQKAQVEALVTNLIATFHHRLETLAWMAPATRQEAIAKLEALRVSVGYPNKFRSYDGLDMRPDDLLGNLQRSSLFNYRYQIARLGKPVDRDDWVMTPQTVNAVNLPLHNALNFPAAILQPPFFDPKAPDAFNYGAIGSVIGHEISHTFDSEGAAFDSHGRVRNWWTPADLAHFNASTAALAKQYDAYKPFPDLALNGKQTLGENIADVAGLLDAYEAFQTSLHGAAPPVVDGFTSDQQFFLAYAQNRTSKTREASLRRQVLTDPHSPGEYRTDTVRNLDIWYPTFNVKPGETLYLLPADRIHIY